MNAEIEPGLKAPNLTLIALKKENGCVSFERVFIDSTLFLFKERFLILNHFFSFSSSLSPTSWYSRFSPEMFKKNYWFGLAPQLPLVTVNLMEVIEHT